MCVCHIIVLLYVVVCPGSMYQQEHASSGWTAALESGVEREDRGRNGEDTLYQPRVCPCNSWITLHNVVCIIICTQDNGEYRGNDYIQQA